MTYVRSEVRRAPVQASVPSWEAAPPTAIPALLAVLDDLVAHGVPHCSWKSNEHLEAALAGETDLDLLVDPAARTEFDLVVARHGLKHLVPPPTAAFPGMEHLLGIDPASRRLFHLHVHHQLVLGEAFVKNHRVAMEREMLEGSRLRCGVRTASPEHELAVLAIRALLKYRARDFVKDLLHVRTPGLRDAVLVELRWLLDQTDEHAVRASLAGCRALPSDVVCDFLRVTARRRRPAVAYLRLRHRTRRWLRDGVRVSPARALATRAGALLREQRRRPTPRMTSIAGGSSLALVGADGAGKTTITRASTEWLGWKVETRTAYLGSKPPSRSARSAYFAHRFFRRGEGTLAAWCGSDALPTRAVGEARATSLALSHLATGRQRARAYAAARREVASGRVVVIDRFPCGELAAPDDRRLLDGPQIAATAGSRPNLAVRLLARAESRIYDGFAPPDAIVVLDVDPAVAARRKPDHDAAVIRSKTAAAATVSRLAASGGPRIRTIDATRPLDDVLADVKSELWRVL